MARSEKGHTYEQIYGREKAAQLRELRRRDARKHPNSPIGRHFRVKNIDRVCDRCGRHFLAADPKARRCEECWKCPGCAKRLGNLASTHCRKCTHSVPSERRTAQLAALHAGTRRNNPAQRPDVRRKISDTVKAKHPSRLYPQKWAEHAAKMRRPKPSRLEDAVAPLLPGFFRQFREKFYSIDFARPEIKLAVEVQGCWHHCCPECFPEPRFPMQRLTLKNDKAKRSYLTSRGWQIVYVWEHDIRKDPEEAIRNNVHNIQGV